MKYKQGKPTCHPQLLYTFIEMLHNSHIHVTADTKQTNVIPRANFFCKMTVATTELSGNRWSTRQHRKVFQNHSATSKNAYQLNFKYQYGVRGNYNIA